VPVLLWGRDVLTDEVSSFGERSCMAGGLGRINANQYLLSLLDVMGMTLRFGS
jgi:2,3-bisphosphoglycerate-independent phosphoglycerate mutase